MSRKIRFRAWDSTDGRMLYRGLFDRNWYATPSNTDTCCNCVKGIKPRDCHMPTMQYTGLKDKNGVEIYEGDIIRDVSPESSGIRWWDGIVTWHDAGSVAFVAEPLPKNKHRGAWGLNYNYILEVIGNIHQQPELLQ